MAGPPHHGINTSKNDNHLNGVSPENREQWLSSLASSEAKLWVSTKDRRKGCKLLRSQWQKASKALESLSQYLRKAAAAGHRLTEEERWLLENSRLLRSTDREARQALKIIHDIPAVKITRQEKEAIPRAYAVASAFLRAVDLVFEEECLSTYLTGIQQAVSLQMGELQAIKPMLQLILLDQLGVIAAAVLNGQKIKNDKEQSPPSDGALRLTEKIITSLHAIGQTEWAEVFELHSVMEHILKTDPSGAYPKMDTDSRQFYREVVADLATRSDIPEEEIAQQAILLARSAKNRHGDISSRVAVRRSHIGYYFVDYGLRLLKKSIGYKPTLKNRIQQIILDWPEVYYVVGVELLTLAIVFLLLRHLGILIPLIPGLLLLIPASQAALGLMNHLTSFLLPPRRLPKLDFSEAIPPECTTMVVIPTLLLSEKQVQHIAASLEVRYLGNRDSNLHFALLTDSPDASQRFDERDHLVELCSSLIRQLNEKYAQDHKGTFFHFHRHRVYNAAQDTWMGWERKRGKLLDLNRLLRYNADSFPVKIGDLSILPEVRYVITLDSDTQLPIDTAHRLVGALAHPLNQAVIDPETNTVADGYAILQPRVGISIESARQSRLANIYSGQTGFDIYTHAVSDIYQDLFGEGSFTGKGIYEVDTFQRVLAGRFPCNALLSHDLIEGAHARAGLVSDIEVIDDYPSHFSAYCRRLHRWVRGDWQILSWLFPRVPDSHGRLIHNPLTLLSRWKIFDNLRRSLIEVDLFLLLLGGWFFFSGGSLYWTAVTLALLLAPTYFQLFFSLLRIKNAPNWKGFFKEQANNFVTGHLQVFIMLAFLPHQALVMLDAIVRTLTRLTITHRRLLEWETAAEAELETKKKTPMEFYLTLTPWVSLAVAAGLAYYRPAALLAAAPILTLWLFAKMFTQWVNRPLAVQKQRLSPQDELFLRMAALRTWRFFRQFSDLETHYLVPDSVQETPPAVATRISPTNLGLQLDAGLAAYRFGYHTLAELVEQTERILFPAKRMPKFRGHFFNWYDTKSLTPLPPLFISTVDSGNLAVCLWTLKQACLGFIKEPLFSETVWQGVQNHVANLLKLSKENSISTEAASSLQDLSISVKNLAGDSAAWIKFLPRLEQEARQLLAALSGTEVGAESPDEKSGEKIAWWVSETLARIENLRKAVQSFLPWMTPEYEHLPIEKPFAAVSLESLPAVIAGINKALDELSHRDNGTATMAQALRTQLQDSLRSAASLSERLQRLADEADNLLGEMNFGFLYNSRRKLFSIGYDVSAGKLVNSNYDLLASEARIAAFIAIAKGDVNKDAWFHLGRSLIEYQGERVLLSWSGTMFEYLMPLLWMRSYPDTILDQSMRVAVRSQQKYARKHQVPWGISEAAYSARDYEGNYQYRAFGIPGLALDQMSLSLVIAPYASFLALPVNAAAATHNLKTMESMGWFGEFGFYESADYAAALLNEKDGYELIRSWMAHHQGMSLLALCNALCNSSVQQWFHQERRVVATELLLHEKIPLSLSVETSEITEPQPVQEDTENRNACAPGVPVYQPGHSGKMLRRTPAAAETEISQTSVFFQTPQKAPSSQPPM